MAPRMEGFENDYSAPGFWREKAEAWHDFLPGIRRRILMNTSAATGTLYRLDAGSEVPLHSHPQAQYGVCLEGRGVFTVGEKAWQMETGDSYYIPPSVRHGLKIDAGSSAILVEFFTPVRGDFLKESQAPDGP
jgi:quercetin dioxygenase-like cupin family protein